jgi:N-acetyl-anhydromuramyl-L-alanine amidase AmpD
MKRFKTLFIGLILLFILLYWWTHRWSYIVIHHSAGEYGNIEFLQKVHRERQSRDLIDAIPYHYIIGNGKGLGVGVVKSDWRKSWHIWGMYVSRHNKDRNFRGLGICLIGNFENHGVSDMQYRALVKLTKELMQRYNIPIENISGHGYTKKEQTKSFLDSISLFLLNYPQCPKESF